MQIKLKELLPGEPGKTVAQAIHDAIIDPEVERKKMKRIIEVQTLDAKKAAVSWYCAGISERARTREIATSKVYLSE